ncbi:MAG: CTP-dependent riboflavin kinase [Verrucomicrobiales bacterium]|jgi:CTP-dependent riboflavin kinase
MAWQKVRGVLVQGHRVASGLGGDTRFPGGTLALQRPHFAERGLDLSIFFHGTLNISIAPKQFRVVEAPRTFRNVKWAAEEPSEDFSFFDCRVEGRKGLIYYPHPETKPEHFQPPDVLEILTSEIPNLSYADELAVEIPIQQLLIE